MTENNENEKDFNIEFPPEAEQLATGFTVDNIKKIYDNIKIGLTLNDCAKLLRLPPVRLTTWYNKNHHNFQLLVDEALSTNKLIHVGRVTNAKDHLQVKASMWMLERKHKEEYTKETIITVNHVMIDNIARVTAETLIKYIKDPEQLRLATQDLRARLAQLTPQLEDGNKIATTEHTEEETD